MVDSLPPGLLFQQSQRNLASTCARHKYLQPWCLRFACARAGQLAAGGGYRLSRTTNLAFPEEPLSTLTAGALFWEAYRRRLPTPLQPVPLTHTLPPSSQAPRRVFEPWGCFGGKPCHKESPT